MALALWFVRDDSQSSKSLERIIVSMVYCIRMNTFVQVVILRGFYGIKKAAFYLADKVLIWPY